MIKIGNELFEAGTSVDETLKILRAYLNKKGIILVDDSDVPYSEEQILCLLEKECVEFKTKTIAQLEEETIEESMQYIVRVERKIYELIDSDNAENVFKWFPEILNAFIELEKISRYFNSNIVSLEKIDIYAKKGLSQMNEQNDNYLRELIEYELLPLLDDFKHFLTRGKSNC